MQMMLYRHRISGSFKGIGIWGDTTPIGWGFEIVNFVWWIGIGHAGTLISAILMLLRQSWRNSINRFAEAMTLFAVACAGIFPAIHVGRPWLAYWMFPYPNTMSILAAVPQSADVGRVCGFDLRDDFRAVLVCGIDSGFSYSARSFRQASIENYLRHAVAGMARVRRGTGIGMRPLIFSWPVWLHRWCFRCTRWSASTSPSALFPDGTLRFSRPTLWLVRFTPALRWW